MRKSHMSGLFKLLNILLFATVFEFSVPISNAAILHKSDTTSDPIQLVDNSNSTFSTNPQDKIDTDIHTEESPQQAPLETIPIDQPEDFQHSAKDDLESFTKKILDEYGNDHLVKESLNALYNAKQLWNEADSLANNFSQDVLSALKLETLIEHDLTQLQKPQPLENLTINKQAYQQVKRAQTRNYKNKYQRSESDFFSHLFRKSTFYYLIGLLIAFSILQPVIKFLLRLLP